MLVLSYLKCPRKFAKALTPGREPLALLILYNTIKQCRYIDTVYTLYINKDEF